MILVGEMRDLETISTALTAAETGHLVFATLHTRTPPRRSTASSTSSRRTSSSRSGCSSRSRLQGIITQQLLPTADGSGRVSCCEVLSLTPAVRNLIREGKTHQIHSVLQTSAAQGHAVDGRRARAARAGGQDHPRARRGALEHARGAPPAARGRQGGLGPRATAGRPADDAPTPSKRSTSPGVPATGELDADSKQAVTDQLRERGLIVLDIVEQKTSVTSQDLFERFKRIKAHELTVMTRQLATMVASGMSILRAFHVLEDQTENEKLKEILGAGPPGRRGRPLARPTRSRSTPNVFNQLYIAMVAHR